MADDLGNAPFVVPDCGAVVQVDPDLAELAGKVRGIRVIYLTEQQLGAYRDDFCFHLRFILSLPISGIGFNLEGADGDVRFSLG